RVSRVRFPPSPPLPLRSERIGRRTPKPDHEGSNPSRGTTSRPAHLGVRSLSHGERGGFDPHGLDQYCPAAPFRAAWQAAGHQAGSGDAMPLWTNGKVAGLRIRSLRVRFPPVVPSSLPPL